MIETADLAFAVSNQAITAHIQIMERNVRRGEDQNEHEHQPNKTVLFGVPVECFTQHTAIIS
jgi:hypothetical protein